ncbi:MAG: UDP-3-O-(3-hydroxymyristoyl)glucosamine N-acyltransferase [Deltaproteobacteria bacterium]
MGIEIRLSRLAERIGARLVGEGDAFVRGIAPIESAGPGEITFLANPKYLRFVRETGADAVIAREPVEGAPTRFLVADNPYLAFARAVEIFHPATRPAPGISPLAFVHPTARIGSEATVSPFSVVQEGAVVGDRTILHPGVCLGEGVRVGEDCLLHPNVVVYRDVRIGSRVILHAGCVIGSDGFGFAPSEEGYRKIPQVGTVEIGDDVEIGANTTIDRAALGVTRVCRGTKLDNLVQVGHNVVIGEDTVIAAQTGISGSVRIGRRVMIGGQAGVAGHLSIGDGVQVGAKSGIASSLSAGESRAWSGIPAVPHWTWLRISGLLPKLPELFRRVRRLERPDTEPTEE